MSENMEDKLHIFTRLQSSSDKNNSYVAQMDMTARPIRLFSTK